jgi:hypothetical protein
LEYLSEDWLFCDRWRALGGQIFGDITIKLDHTGTFRYPGNPEVFSKITGKQETASIAQNAGDLESHRKPLAE